MLLFTLLGALGALYVKKATLNSPATHRLVRDKDLYVGLSFYFLSTIVNILVLKELPYTIVLPCSAITYIWGIYLSKAFLKERVGSMKIAGIVCIILGTIMIAAMSGHGLISLIAEQ